MAEFGDLPELFKHYDDIELYSFSYDHANLQFNIAGQNIGVVSPDLARELFYPSGETQPVSRLGHEPVWLHIGSPLATPIFNSWLREHFDSSQSADTHRVMLEVFEEVHGMKVGAINNKPDRLFGFSAAQTRPGHLELSVLGNCACLGVCVDGHVVDYHEWDTGYAQYEFHNIDFDAQRVSLLAGIGHLANKAIR